MLCSHKRGNQLLTHAATDEPWECCEMSEISPTQRSEVYDSTCMRDTGEATSWGQKLKQRFPEQRALFFSGDRLAVWIVKTFWGRMVVVDDAQYCECTECQSTVHFNGC